MEFYTVYKDPRPVRLCETTRQFAYESDKDEWAQEAVLDGAKWRADRDYMCMYE